jgi:hypothetical protein
MDEADSWWEDVRRGGISRMSKALVAIGSESTILRVADQLGMPSATRDKRTFCEKAGNTQ